jgi:uncharacterized protein (TIGR02271 family)
MQTTTHSIVGVFEDYATAQRVKKDGTHRDTSGGGISGFFRRIFGSDDYDDYGDRYVTAVDRGHAVVSVNTSDESRQNLAADIMDRNGVIDIDERAASWGTGKHSAFDKDRTERSIPVVREDLEVGKRMVRRGGVRIVNRVTEEPVEEDITLREEHVRVDRRPVDRPATERDFADRNEMIEVTEMAEEPVVGKRTRVVEEVSVGKDVTEHTEKIRDKVRRTDVDVENLGSDYDADFRKHHTSRYGTADYDDYAPTYQYGYRMGSDKRYRRDRWEDVEADIRRDYDRTYPGGTWDRIKDSVRYGWERAKR